MTTESIPSDAWTLAPHPSIPRAEGPLVLAVLDGLGVGPEDGGNAWHLARTPFLDAVFGDSAVRGQLRAHGVAVGMPSDGDMGNSEVGHNALGAGRVFDQGAKLVQEAVRSGAAFEGECFRWLVDGAKASGGALHLLGLWSDGNVHSHIEHAYAALDAALARGVPKVRLHVLLDGRDVGETTALDYLEPLEARCAELRQGGRDVAIASGGGRMVTTMDRYEADWSIVERGWRAHVLGEGRPFPSASEAVRTFRAETPGVIDQNLPDFTVVDADGAPLGAIADGDSVLMLNFRGDRALEITQAFEAAEGAFAPFDRQRVPDVRYAGMMQYDGDLGLPTRHVVPPPTIDRTMGEYLARQGLKQLALSETQKYGHVTYFFNGNRSGMFDEALERYVEVPSDIVEFWERPWMKAAEITDRALAEIDAFAPDFVRLNYANGDMVGHTGVLRSAIMALEALDLSLQRLVDGVLARGGRLFVTADHGNCEEMAERDKKTGQLVAGRSPEGFKPRTSHTLNPVPFAVLGDGAGEVFGTSSAADGGGLANVAATCLNLLGFIAPPDYRPSLIAPR